MTQFKKFSQCLFISLMIITIQSVHLNYKKEIGILTLYQTQNGKDSQKPLHFKVDFTSKKLVLDPKLKKNGEYLYLNKHRKHQVDLKTILNNNPEFNKDIEYNFQQKVIENGDKQIAINGIIGLLPNSNIFMQIVKLALNRQEVSLFFSRQNSGMEILDRNCQKPLFFPITLKIDGSTKTDVKINRLSLSNQLSVNSQFVKKVTQKTKNPFILNSSQYQQRLKLQVNTKVQQAKVKDLFNSFCDRIGASNSYECQILSNSQQEYGSILFLFDIAICEKGIEIYSNSIEPQETYFWIHYLLLLLQFIALAIYLNQDKSIQILRKIIKKKKGY